MSDLLLLQKLKVSNFRSIKDQTFDFDDLSVLIGKNNSGKTNILDAIEILLEGTAKSIEDSDYWDAAQPIVLECEFRNVDRFLDLCSEKHRSKVKAMIDPDGVLRLRRSFGATIEDSAKLMTVDTSTGADKPLGTGIDAELRRFLPEVVQIPALADVSAETTASSGALRRIVNQILATVHEKAQPSLDKAYEDANRLLNVIEGKDNRVPELQHIEKDVTGFLQETFAQTTVHLKVDLPDVKKLLAQIDVDVYDGDLTTYARKGHGLQRCLYLSLLRTLAKKMRDSQQSPLKRPIMILFEEPELFLHPSAQDQMREALVQISKHNQVLIATHSPSMVSVGTLSQLVLIKKVREPKDSNFGLATVRLVPNRIGIAGHNEKDLLSILNLHRSSRVFFAHRVLLVEGPSDVHLLNAIAERLGMGRLESKDCTIIEIGGKDKLKTAQDILSSLGMEAYGLADLDFVWRGARGYLGQDRELSQFCQKLTERVKDLDENKAGEEKRRLVKSDAGLKAEAGRLGEKLLPNKVFVLKEGEIEDYVGLSKSSKGEYVTAAHEISDGTRPLTHEQELSEIFKVFVGTT